jgi:hypothetical protein
VHAESTTTTPRVARCLILVLALGLAGCASVRPASHRSDAPGAVIDLATRSGSWPSSQHVLDSAVDHLVHRCLAAHGFDDPDVDQAPPPSPEDEAAAIDLPARREHGYGIVSGTSDGQAPVDPYNQRLSPQDQTRYNTVLFGPSGSRINVDVGGGQTVTSPGQGCEADARRQVAGNLGLWARLFYAPGQYDNRLSEQASTAPRYLTAVGAWHSCMTARGYPYPTPDAAQKAMRDRHRQVGATAEFRTQEIAVAVADGECAGQAHLPSTALAVRRHLVGTLPEADLRALADLVAHRDAALRRATALLATLQPSSRRVSRRK